ncbi:MAG: uncharacterized protein QOJ79_1123 [Actinomycetota bacterium]|nr:uncharacterized protein [Actinomycetota bacterium]
MAVPRPGVGLPARPRLLAPVIVIVAVIFVIGAIAIALYTDLLWFREVGYSRVFTTVLRTKALLFLVFGLVMAMLIGANLAIAYRLRPPFRPMSLEQQNLERYRVAVEPFLRTVLLLASAVFGLFAGLSAASRWQVWLLFRNATSFGLRDAQFHKDISYFAMTYPFQRFVLGFLLTAVILSLLASAATHYLFGGLRLQTAGDKVSPAARAHLSVLLGVVVLLKAVAYWLDRYGLAFSDRGVVQGASYTDVNSVLPAKTILVGIAVVCALLFFANIVVRNILLPAGALALLVISAVLIGGVYPAYTQQFRVKPNEVQRESPYIERNIEATRLAYGIDKAVVTQYEAKTTASKPELRADQTTVPNARLLDPNVLATTFEQLQRIRSYFGFNTSLDIDRYNVGGAVQDYIVAAREIDQSGLRPDQRNWINQRLTYTHGNGFVAAPANEVDGEGKPVFAVGNVPPSGVNGAASPIRIDQPRIYYGELSPEYSVVNTAQAEIDGPLGTGDAQATSHYDGSGGVQLSSPMRKLLYALKFREKNLLLSGAIKSDSRLMYIRKPAERVKKVAPFLELDEDPYPAVIDGKILWIIDGYTTSSGYPYAQRTVFGDVTRDSQNGRAALPRNEVNYIRNSVKATVDAYTGKVTLYTWDENDPVLKTWGKAFKGILKPKSAISDALRAHLRYPEDLFKVQRDLLSQYHVTDPKSFYSKEDFWGVPADPAEAVNHAANADNPQPVATAVSTSGNTQGPDQPPYYALLGFPGQGGARFSLTTSYVARARPNLAAFASVSSDPDDYGTIRVLQLPRNAVINGPGQVANLFLSTREVAEALFALRRNGTQLTFGNLLTLPVGGGLLNVQPVYVSAQGTESYPVLQQVIVAFGGTVKSGSSLQVALDGLFGAGTTTPSASPGPTPSGGGDLAAAIAAADAAFRAGQAALKSGDFAAYGEAQKRLEAALNRAASLSGASPSPSARPSPSPH